MLIFEGKMIRLLSGAELEVLKFLRLKLELLAFFLDESWGKDWFKKKEEK